MTDKDFYINLFANFFDEQSLNTEFASLLEEARHVHFSHPESWKREGNFKDYASSKFAFLIEEDRSLIPKLLELKDRTVSMLTYRAIELLKNGHDLSKLSNHPKLSPK